MAILDREYVLKREVKLIGLRRFEVLVLEEGLELFFLLGFEVSFVLEPEPAGFLEVGLGEELPPCARRPLPR